FLKENLNKKYDFYTIQEIISGDFSLNYNTVIFYYQSLNNRKDNGIHIGASYLHIANYNPKNYRALNEIDPFFKIQTLPRAFLIEDDELFFNKLLQSYKDVSEYYIEKLNYYSERQ
ncbi:MAG: hypothetical protein AAF549_09600, partial [Pseudomonadota bacterium]